MQFCYSLNAHLNICLALKEPLEHTGVSHSYNVRSCAKCLETDSQNLWLLFCVIFSQSATKSLAVSFLLTSNLNEYGCRQFFSCVLVSLNPDMFTVTVRRV